MEISKKQKVIYVGGGGNEREWPYGELQGQGTNSCDCLNKYLSECNFGN